MQEQIVDHEIRLIPYYPAAHLTLPWYQDPTLCLQVDGRPDPYDLPRLERMYHYLNEHGMLYYICYQGQLCGDVCGGAVSVAGEHDGPGHAAAL